jgi:hypothetical protein
VRKGGKFLRSFGKLWEVVLPTFLLITNELVQDCAGRKKCAIGKTGVREFYWAEVLNLRGFTSGNNVFSIASVRKFSVRSYLTPFGMTGAIGRVSPNT